MQSISAATSTVPHATYKPASTARVHCCRPACPTIRHIARSTLPMRTFGDDPFAHPDTLTRGQMYDAHRRCSRRRFRRSRRGAGAGRRRGTTAVRVELNLPALNRMGIGLETVRAAIVPATPIGLRATSRTKRTTARSTPMTRPRRRPTTSAGHRVSQRCAGAPGEVADVRRLGAGHSQLRFHQRQTHRYRSWSFAAGCETSSKRRARARPLPVPEVRRSRRRSTCRSWMERTTTIKASLARGRAHADDFGDARDPGGVPVPAATGAPR